MPVLHGLWVLTPTSPREVEDVTPEDSSIGREELDERCMYHKPFLFDLEHV
jgi:hypothetical protein